MYFAADTNTQYSDTTRISALICRRVDKEQEDCATVFRVCDARGQRTEIRGQPEVGNRGGGYIRQS